MKITIRKPVLTLLVVFVIMLLMGSALIRYKIRSSAETETGTIRINGIRNEAVIRRDSLGVPCIQAENEEDLFFAAGYATAADRLWQMTAMKMLAQGRISEIAGKDTLPVDIFMRSLGFRRFVEESMAGLDSHMRSILESFSRGVNAYVKMHETLPAEFLMTGFRPEKWKPEDTFYVVCVTSLSLSYNIMEELCYLVLAGRVGYNRVPYLVPVYPGESLPYDEVRKCARIRSSKLLSRVRDVFRAGAETGELVPFSVPASNNWALSGKKTKSGKSIIANDTHLFGSLPNPWMIMHLKCPSYEAAGVTVPGLPLVLLGYNGKIAWGATMVMADSQDIFIEKLRTVDGVPCYLYRSRWLPVKLKKERFRISGHRDTVIEMGTTRHGPLLNQALKRMPMPTLLLGQPVPMDSDYGLALSWALGDGAGSLNGFYNLGMASTMDAAREAISMIESVYLNMVYGNSDNIALQVSGRFPVRRKGTGQLPSPGWEGKYDWTGYLPVSENPFRMNPSSGYIATANDRITTRDYPFHLTSSWYKPSRGEYLKRALEEMKNADVEDTRRLQFSRFSLFAEKVQDMLFSKTVLAKIEEHIREMNDTDAQERAREALEYLLPSRFDAVMANDSVNATVFNAFVHSFLHETFLDELGPEDSVTWEAFTVINALGFSALEDHLLHMRSSPFWDNRNTRIREHAPRIIARSLAGAIEMCEKKAGKDRTKWCWGMVHQYLWEHDFAKKAPLLAGYFNRGPYPAGGDVHTVNVASFTTGRDFSVWGIPAMRMIVDFSLVEPAALVATPGQSGNPASPHYDDMIPFFLEGRNHPLPFGCSAVERQYASVLKLARTKDDK